MPQIKIVVLTILAMVAFAGNSLLCRLALDEAGMDPASFTTIRIASGAVVLWLLVRLRGVSKEGKGNWLSGFFLFSYAACFSFGYVNLCTATGALLLFSSVQATMIVHGVLSGERLVKWQFLGIFLALGGLVVLFLPGLAVPSFKDSSLMIGSGVAWGFYSLRGQGRGDPTSVTAGNFILGLPFAVVLSLVMIDCFDVNYLGACSAIASGAITSGIGYAIWYLVLPFLRVTSAATLQLSVPVIASFGGAMFLDEPITERLVMASIAILGGIGLVILNKRYV